MFGWQTSGGERDEGAPEHLSLKIFTYTTGVVVVVVLHYYIDIVVLIYLVIWDRHENTTLDWMGCGISLCFTAVRLFDNSPDSLSLFGRGWLGSVWLGSYCAPCRVFSTELHTECGRIWRKSIALLSLSCCVSFCISYSAAHSVLYNLGCIYAARSTIYCAIL